MSAGADKNGMRTAIVTGRLGTRPVEPVLIKSPGLPPNGCSCTWSVHVLMDESREKDGQFPRVWDLKYIHMACWDHAKLRA